MEPRHLAMMGLFIGAAFSASPEEIPWYRDPGTPITLRASGFVFETHLPRGWSTIDGEIIPPPELASACSVHGEFYPDRDWNHFLAAALGAGDFARASREKREVLKIGGHPAVSTEYRSDGKLVRSFYIDLSDRYRPAATAWTVEGDTTSREGLDCSDQFLMWMVSSRIVRDPVK